MTHLAPCLGLLAQIPLDLHEALEPWRNLSDGVKEFLILLAAFVFLTVSILIWAAFFRRAKKRRRRHTHHHQASPEPSTPLVEPHKNGEQRKRKRWRRRRRRDHRPRNPTLAETGGLPPVRAEKPPDLMP